MPVYIFLVLALPMENYKNQNYHLTNNIIIPKIRMKNIIIYISIGLMNKINVHTFLIQIHIYFEKT